MQITSAENFLLFLEVDTSTGDTTIRNDTGETINIDYYQIMSDNGGGSSLSADDSNWTSLQDQNLAGFSAGDGSGNGWEEAGGAGPGVLSESFLTGNSQLADGASLSLGTAFDAGNAQDVTLRYGDVTGGSRMYIDGIAVAADAQSDFAANSADMVLGSNTGGDDQSFTGGTEEFLTGILDDLTMFVVGDNSNDAGSPTRQDWGAFDIATDNAFAAFTLTGIPGDVNNDGLLDQSDKNVFVSGWMQEKIINGVRVGDIDSHAAGDLNFDGITDVFDLAIMQNALVSSGMDAITSAELARGAVPEPSTLVLLIGIALASIGRHRYR